MDPYYAGWLSIVPPVLAIVLALITKEVFSSLLLGILSGALIYSIGVDADFVAIHTIDVTFKTMAERIDFNIILFAKVQNLSVCPFLQSARSVGLRYFFGGRHKSLRRLGYKTHSQQKSRHALHRRTRSSHFH